MKHSTEQTTDALAQQNINVDAGLTALIACVNGFADAMKDKLRNTYLAGRRGWDDPNWSQEDILRQLKEHVEKGDMVDVASYAMFAWNQQTK